MPDVVLGYIADFFALSWWLWLFVILVPATKSVWLFWRGTLFSKSIEYRMMVMELVMPREIHRSPRAMEQVLMVIHSLRNIPNDLREKWWDGEFTRTFTMEMVSFGGEIRFFIRFHFRHRPLVEAAFYSYYPDVELKEIDDYIDQLPEGVDEMYRQGYDMWGSEMVLAREDAYPIRSYLDFESPDEEKQYDPLSVFIEVMAKAKKEEIVAVQLVSRPKDPKWHEAKKWKDFVNRLRERGDEQKKKPSASTVADFPGGPLPALSVKGAGEEDAPLKPLMLSFMRTPGETDVLKAVESNLSKPAFDVAIRILYFSPKALFYDSYARRGVAGSFNQYAAMDLNYFIQNVRVGTRTRLWAKPYIFAKTRGDYRKESIIKQYRGRSMPFGDFLPKLITSTPFRLNFASRTSVLNAQSLATIFHPPTFQVLTAPHMRRVESKRTGAPAGMGIYGEEEEIDRFQ